MVECREKRKLTRKKWMVLVFRISAYTYINTLKKEEKEDFISFHFNLIYNVQQREKEKESQTNCCDPI
jgi:hypothetical protein